MPTYDVSFGEDGGPVVGFVAASLHEPVLVLRGAVLVDTWVNRRRRDQDAAGSAAAFLDYLSEDVDLVFTVTVTPIDDADLARAQEVYATRGLVDEFGQPVIPQAEAAVRDVKRFRRERRQRLGIAPRKRPPRSDF